MPDGISLPLDFAPGVQRDTTKLDTNCYVDALWCRFRNNRPRKMLGYQRLTDLANGIPRKINLYYLNGLTYLHVGSSASIQQFVLDASGNLVSFADRTPTSGFVPNPYLGYTMDTIFDTVSGAVQIVCHAAPDLNSLGSDTQSTPFIGQVNSAAPLLQFANPSPPSGTWTKPNIAGGIVCVQPYVFDFDINGLVGWSAPNLPQYLGTVGGTTGAGSARVSGQKIVQGMALRGGGANSPAALFWSMSELITATFVGSSAGFFAFNTVSPSSSILSSDAVIEYDGLYFWLGVDRLLVYNGTVVEVPNKFNNDWFFDNLNRTYAAKTFAFKVPRFGEIWFCAPLFGNTEPSHAMIYNVRDNIFYDTALPSDFRTCGSYIQGFPYPILGSAGRTANGYKLWMHEFGVDAIDGATQSAIRSYFETPYFFGPAANPPTDQALATEQLEPDFIQTGDMQVSVVSAFNARSGETSGPTQAIPAAVATTQDQVTNFKQTQRLPRVHFESNTPGGNYIGGKQIMHGTPSEERRTGGVAGA